jgi:hypothetical protein
MDEREKEELMQEILIRALALGFFLKSRNFPADAITGAALRLTARNCDKGGDLTGEEFDNELHFQVAEMEHKNDA